MGDLTGVKVGDELLLVERNNRSGREPKTVTVAKVGTKLVHILRYPKHPDGGTETYRIDTGIRNDNYGHSRLETPEHYADRHERGRLEKALFELGIDTARARPTTDQLRALLAVAKDVGI